MNTKFWSENLKGKDCSEYLAVDGEIIFEWEHVDWMRLAQDRGQLRPLENMVMNLGVPKRRGI
jgi:hypothetical protein